MTHSRTLAAALAVAAALSVAAAPPSSARPATSVMGSYFGSLSSRHNDFWTLELNLNWQQGHRAGGTMSISAIYGGVSVAGTISNSNRLELSGRTVNRGRVVHFHLRGRYHPGSPETQSTIDGTYTVTGGAQERGTFTLIGPQSE